MNPIKDKNTDYDIIIVGAGWAGMYMLIKARELGLTAKVIESEPEVGGTWYRNRYPGLRCDVESLEYSLSFSNELQQEWNWSERFSAQPEILEYAKHVADKFDLKKDIQFETKVTSIQYDDESAVWNVGTSRNEQYTSLFCVMATGLLSVPKVPDLKGLDRFSGEVYYSTNWPHEKVDFSGKKVGVIGTGSTGVQIIPVVAEECKELYVFQRTPSYSLPAHNGPMDRNYEKVVKDNYAEHRKYARETTIGGIPFVNYDVSALEVSPAERYRVYNEIYDRGAPFAFMSAFNDLLINEDANKTVASFAADKIRERVENPDVAEKLIPHGQYFGTRRLCIDTNYYETYNKDHVHLVSVKETPIQSIQAAGIETVSDFYDLDVIIFATGYDAITGALLAIDIQGKQGVSLKEKWKDIPYSNLGLMVSDFPNMFMVTGPGSPSGFSNVIVSIEQHIDWISDCISHLKGTGNTHIETTREAEEAWVNHATEVANSTLFPRGNSWYMGDNIPGKPRFFMAYIGGVGNYRKICDDVTRSGYQGFELY